MLKYVWTKGTESIRKRTAVDCSHYFWKFMGIKDGQKHGIWHFVQKEQKISDTMVTYVSIGRYIITLRQSPLIIEMAQNAADYQ